ncbi:MAG TPA: hypothetical protein VKV57_03560 [bacterium]|nr:hypothetical protein [bacterium]
MSTVATVSLVVIAATCIIAVVAFVVFLALLWRVVSRVEAILTLVQRALPGMVIDVRRILTKVDQEILGEVVRNLERVSAVIGSGASTLEHMQQTVRRVAQDVILPPMATAAGLLSAIREGLQWFRPSGDGSRR